MSKYEPLLKYLAGQSAKRLTLEMQEIEQILGEQLPASAHRHVAWGSNGTTHHHPQCRAWMENGYHTVYVRDTIRKGYIEFEKQSPTFWGRLPTGKCLHFTCKLLLHRPFL